MADGVKSLAAWKPDTVADTRAALAAILRDGGVDAADLEARDILAAVLDESRLWPSLHPDEQLTDAVVVQATAAARARAGGAPFAYAVGRAAFRYLTLAVDERVLIPRQETEHLVEIVLAMCDAPGGIAVDVGTGSGAIALSIATEGHFDRVIATDICSDAVRIAAENAELHRERLRAPVEVRQGSLLRPLADVAGHVSLLVSNPPYIAYDEAATLPPNVRDREPSVALFSGDGGLAATRAIVRGGAVVLAPGGIIAIEVDARRASLAAEMLATDARYSDVTVRLDLTGRERFVVARREGG